MELADLAGLESDRVSVPQISIGSTALEGHTPTIPHPPLVPLYEYPLKGYSIIEEERHSFHTLLTRNCNSFPRFSHILTIV